MKKRKEMAQEETPKSEVEYRIVNLKEAIQSVPMIDEEGQIRYLNLRLQGRNGQKPPVLQSWQLTDSMRELEKRGFIKIEKI